MRRRLLVLLALLLASSGIPSRPAYVGAQDTDETASGVRFDLVAEGPSGVKGATFQIYRFRFVVLTEENYPKIPFPTTDSKFPEGYPESIEIKVRTGPFVIYIDKTEATLVTSRKDDIRPLLDLDDEGIVDFEADYFDDSADVIKDCSGSDRRTCTLPGGVGIQLEEGDVIFLSRPAFCLVCFLARSGGDVGQIEVGVVVPDGADFSWIRIPDIAELDESEGFVPSSTRYARAGFPALNPGPGCNGKVA